MAQEVITMSTDEVEKWSETHFGLLALARTLIGLVNVGLASLICLRVFGWL